MSRAVGAVAAALVLVFSGCGHSASAPTCADYANADAKTREMMVSDQLQQHGLDHTRAELQAAVNAAAIRQCGPLHPDGHDTATRNSSQPFAATVNWAGLQGTGQP